ncbi:short-chain dehydrogenase [Burkholderia multivorans]|uniref:Rossmann fold domain-containing protein n=1 Tax=Burkholderia multivorans TaxID=87883 RepID=UPI002097404C|nr:short-chain dehydrogenase [Burkholderia multivorans]MCO7341861.1 short-chain dehydrogenase [Burkholderia multivorans]MCO7347812.1 short-chain dehydrogenase [Burkholderia multivorans]HDR9349311.1 short-chain dehydrogenase [Burkholderia multivorans]HDR9372177.1 short-chain dehydrogenase [Burkholderia multivorans]
MTVSADTPAARVALVAGAFDRRADPVPLGRALAAAFARRGWDVALQCGPGAARADADAAAADAAALGRRAAVLDADLALEGDAATLIAACGATLGRPACAVFVTACAGADDAQTIDGATLAAALADATPDAARDDESLRACAIHVLDQALFHPAPAQLSHALMQAALSRATSALALALAPKVRVAALVRGRAPHADDIAAAACYLANAPGVTGATLTVDGGEHLVPPADGPNE